MTPDTLKELRSHVERAFGERTYEMAKAHHEAALALIDAELALHSTAEIAGTRAGLAALDEEAQAREVCRYVRSGPYHGIADCSGDNYSVKPNSYCPDCGKRVEVV